RGWLVPALLLAGAAVAGGVLTKRTLDKRNSGDVKDAKEVVATPAPKKRW
ncbi:hypothetical protein MNEG_15174, partial [Monoraphidium neglectum]